MDIATNQSRLSRAFGPKVFTAIPALWMTELAALGYEPACLAAPAGQLVVFDTNIIHRGSRPRYGKYRDAVLWEFWPSLR